MFELRAVVRRQRLSDSSSCTRKALPPSESRPLPFSRAVKVAKATRGHSRLSTLSARLASALSATRVPPTLQVCCRAAEPSASLRGPAQFDLTLGNHFLWKRRPCLSPSCYYGVSVRGASPEVAGGAQDLVCALTWVEACCAEEKSPGDL